MAHHARPKIAASIALPIVLCLAGAAGMMHAVGPVQGSAAASDAAATVATLQKIVKDGHYEQAQATARDFVERETAAGRLETVETVDAMRYWVEALWRGDKANDPETLAIAQRALDLAGRVVGESDARYSNCLSGVANVYNRREEYDLARTYWTRSLGILEKLYGSESRQVALMLNNLAIIEGVTGHFDKCRMLMERAVAIQEKVLGPDHPDLAPVHSNYAKFLHTTGDLLGADAESERAVQINAMAHSGDHPSKALYLTALADIKSDLGDYVAARALYERAIAMQDKSLPHESGITATARASFAMVLASMGRFDEAMAQHEQALAALEKAVGPNHSRVARARSEMGALLVRMGRPADAKRLFLLALASQEAIFGPVHQDVAGTLNRLARVEAETGEAQEARGHYERALAAVEMVYDPSHPRVAESLDGLGDLHLAAGEKDDAARSLNRALSIREASLGPSHPDVAKTLVGLARVRWSEGDAPGALAAALRAEDILRTSFHQTMRGLSESEALSYEKVRVSGLDVALSALASVPPNDRDPAAVRDVWDAMTRSRALVLDQIAARHQALASYGTPELQALARDRTAATNRLASLVVRGPDPDHPKDYRDALARASEEKDRLERLLAEKLGETADARPAASLAGLRSALPAGAALLAYVEYWKTPSTGRPEAAYAALALRKDRDAPIFLDLGRARTIDALVDRLSEETEPARATLGLGASKSEMKYRDAGNDLRKRIWDPLAHPLRGVKKVFVVPDGALSLVNVSALPVDGGRYLIEAGPLLHYLSAERDLLPHATRSARGRGVLLMGGPDYDASPRDAGRGATQVAEAAGPGADVGFSTEAPPVFRGSTTDCPDFRNLHFEPLPGSLLEVSEIDAQAIEAPPLRLTGSQASEAAFKRLAPDRRLLHLATHGFFLDQACGAAPGRGASAGSESEARVLRQNPLLLSGVALAAANRRAQAGPDEEDGILTAEEIASIDLSGVEWVVLSACKTALGAVQSGEGILGLRRAFEVAGARTLVMSLWSVDDRTTLVWMKTLYGHRAKGLSTADAMRHASLDALRDRRAAGKSTHPFYWGAFVAVGDWR